MREPFLLFWLLDVTIQEIHHHHHIRECSWLKAQHHTYNHFIEGLSTEISEAIIGNTFMYIRVDNWETCTRGSYRTYAMGVCNQYPTFNKLPPAIAIVTFLARNE